MKEKILRVAYDTGLYAQGTPDSWDEEALYQFGKYLIEECMLAVERTSMNFTGTTYDRDLADTAKDRCLESIAIRFKDENIR